MSSLRPPTRKSTLLLSGLIGWLNTNSNFAAYIIPLLRTVALHSISFTALCIVLSAATSFSGKFRWLVQTCLILVTAPLATCTLELPGLGPRRLIFFFFFFFVFCLPLWTSPPERSESEVSCGWTARYMRQIDKIKSMGGFV